MMINLESFVTLLMMNGFLVGHELRTNELNIKTIKTVKSSHKWAYKETIVSKTGILIMPAIVIPNYSQWKTNSSMIVKDNDLNFFIVVPKVGYQEIFFTFARWHAKWGSVHALPVNSAYLEPRTLHAYMQYKVHIMYTHLYVFVWEYFEKNTIT